MSEAGGGGGGAGARSGGGGGGGGRGTDSVHSLTCWLLSELAHLCVVTLKKRRRKKKKKKIWAGFDRQNPVSLLRLFSFLSVFFSFCLFCVPTSLW